MIEAARSQTRDIGGSAEGMAGVQARDSGGSAEAPNGGARRGRGVAGGVVPVLTPTQAALVAYLEKGTQYGPNADQLPIVLSPYKYNLLTGGEGSGKSIIVAWYLAADHYGAARQILGVGGAQGDAPLRGRLYWLMGADYAQVEKEFEYAKRFYANIGLLERATSRVDPGWIVLKDGTIFKTISAKDEEKIGRESPDAIAICEAGLVTHETYLRSLSRVSRVGGKLFMSGTIEKKYQAWFGKVGREWQFGTPEGCKSWSLATWTNRALYPGGRQDPKILRLENMMPDDYFLERMAGIPAPPSGMVFPEIRAEIHVREVQYEPGSPVYIAEDPGYSGPSPHALEMCQIIGGQIRWYDEVYVSGKTTEEIIETVQKGRPWWKDVRKLVSDPHGKDQHHSTNSVAEIWWAKTGLVARGERVHIMAGIETFRTYIKPDVFSGKSPMVFSPRCRGLLSELGLVPNARGEIAPFMWEKDAEGNPIPDRPQDQGAHAVKALWYFLVEHFGYSRVRPRRAPDVVVRIA